MKNAKKAIQVGLQTVCETPRQLHLWLKHYLGLNVPRKSVCPGHSAPFDYVWRAYREPGEDLVVWAPRGGGKTRLGAAITLVELLHKPGIQVRILGGSKEQSEKMWQHLRDDLEDRAAHLIDKKRSRSGAIQLLNGSKAAILTQSERAVRGLHVQKMRCDEVELFKRNVWEAAQLVSKSKPGQTAHLRSWKHPEKMHHRKTLLKGTLEAISTHHKAWGLMNEVISSAQSGSKPVVKWCIFEVIEKCPEAKPCNTCELEKDCKGIAKKCNGYFSIDDVIAMKRRVSKEAWETEMLCKRPSIKGAVFPNFSTDKHVQPASGLAKEQSSEVWLGMDFGFNNPFVCLWIRSYEDGTIHVFDEYIQPGRMLHEHLDLIESKEHPRAKAIACDPAGNGRNDQTAESNISFLKRRGYSVKSRGSHIVDGIEKIRFALCPAIGKATLFIDPNCKQLIAAMQSYHYADGGSELPVKDGADHCVDALRYFFINRHAKPASWRKY